METQSIQCYRMRPYFGNLGVVTTLVFFIFGLTSVLVAYFNVDGSFEQPDSSAVLLGVFWSFFVLLGVWLIVASYRYRLFTSDTEIRQVGVLRDRTTRLSHVNEMKWRTRPAGGSVRLSSPEGVLTIELGHFSKDDRARLISFLNSKIDAPLQVGWLDFRKQFDDSPERRARSRRFERLIPIIFGLHAIVFFVFWWQGFGEKTLMIALLNVLATAYFGWALIYKKKQA